MLSLVPMSPRRFRCAPPVLALFLALSAARAQSDPVAGTLPEDYVPALKPILATALKQSPQIIAKEIEISQREAQVLGVDAQRLPRVDGHLDYTRNQTAISGNSATQTTDGGFFYGAGVSQPVFHWGALDNQSAAARIEVQIAEKNYAEGYRLVAYDLRQKYLSLIVRKAGLRQARFALGLTEADLRLTKEDLTRGLASKETVAAQQLAFDETSLGLEAAEAKFAELKRDFARIAGIGPMTEDAIPLEIPKPAYAAGAVSELLAGLLRDGAKSTFQAQVYELLIHEADLNYKIAKVRLLPKFNASAGYSLENTTNATTTSVLQQGVARETATLNAQWTIFDGFAARGAKAEALAGKRQHERELKTNAEETLDRAQTLQRLLAIDARALEFAEIHRQMVVDELSHAKDEFGRGNASQRDLDAIVSNLYAQEANTAVARATLLIHWSEFVSIAGADPVLNNLPAHYAREKR
jgi:outer membrane protein TolC